MDLKCPLKEESFLRNHHSVEAVVNVLSWTYKRNKCRFIKGWAVTTKSLVKILVTCKEAVLMLKMVFKRIICIPLWIKLKSLTLSNIQVMTNKTTMISNLQDIETHQFIKNYKIHIIKFKQQTMVKKFSIRKSFPLSFRL